ncbi:Uncharacterized protein At5g65660 [Linum grandiflorum]
MVLSQIDEDDRTAIGVPLGLALLLLGLFSLTAVFICCLQWGYLGSLWDAPHQHDTNETHQQKQSDKEVERLPVLMPGDELPRFIAMACPCQPPILETRIQVQI